MELIQVINGFNQGLDVNGISLTPMAENSASNLPFPPDYTWRLQSAPFQIHINHHEEKTFSTRRFFHLKEYLIVFYPSRS